MAAEVPILVVVGGGAAGYFGAIEAASSAGDRLRVFILESSRLPLQKVKISGGGRCNVMHDATKGVSLIAQGYPRGSKQLLGPFNARFGPMDAAEWFQGRGVKLKTEADGRMFPTTDSSQTIIDCLEDAARKAGVHILTAAKVKSIARVDDQTAGGASFEVTFTTSGPLSPKELQRLECGGRVGTRAVARADPVLGATAEEKGLEGEGDKMSAEREKMDKPTYRVLCTYVLQATGSSREGHAWAAKLGHEVAPPVPSLFTLTIKDPRLEGLAGLSVQDAELKLLAEASPVHASTENTDDRTVAGTKKKKKKKKSVTVSQRGPLLITHTGVSGPAALKLSAFGARELSNRGYKGRLVVNWVAGSKNVKTLEELNAFGRANPKKAVHTFCPLACAAGDPPPRRLWQSLARAAGVEAGDNWGGVSKAKMAALAQELTTCEFQIIGKGTFKEEFVTCGGIVLSAMDMKSMESRLIPDLFFAGEVVDIDGITGGYNFQSAWTTGWLAGNSIGTRVKEASIGP